MNTIQIRKMLYTAMEKHLESMCAYCATGEKARFHYYAGKAANCQEILEQVFHFEEWQASEHIKAMWEIRDKNW